MTKVSNLITRDEGLMRYAHVADQIGAVAAMPLLFISSQRHTGVASGNFYSISTNGRLRSPVQIGSKTGL